MVLDNYRRSLDWWLEPMARRLGRTHPDVFTWWSLAFAAAGGAAFYLSGPGRPWLLLAAWACVLANSVFDLLDGKIAKLNGLATPRGDYLDHCLDRFSDALLIAGVALSPWARAEWGLLAILGTVLTSYMGTQAQAVGLRRNYGGLLGRADRMVLLMAIPLLEFLHTQAGFGYPPAQLPWPSTYLELMLVYFGVMGMLTAVQRFVVGLRAFGADGQVPK